MIRNVKCKICKNEIDPEEYFTNKDESCYMCSEECANIIKNTGEEIYHVQYCIAYDECKTLNNIRRICIFKERYTGHGFNPWEPMPKFPNFCHPSEISIIKSNMKLLNFVEESEKRATELNKKTLKLATCNIKLTKAMLLLSIVNIIGLSVQICLQIFN